MEGGFLFCGGWNFSKSVNVGPTFIREMRVITKTKVMWMLCIFTNSKAFSRASSRFGQICFSKLILILAKLILILGGTFVIWHIVSFKTFFYPTWSFFFIWVIQPLSFSSIIFDSQPMLSYVPSIIDVDSFFKQARAKLHISRTKVFYHYVYLHEVNIQVHNGHGVLVRLVSYI